MLLHALQLALFWWSSAVTISNGLPLESSSPGTSSSSSSASCPMNYLLHPCHCTVGGRITCDGEYSYNLKAVFEKLNRSLTAAAGASESSNPTNIFDAFILNNTDIGELPEGVLGGVRFRKVELVDALSLKRLAGGAFGESARYVEEFVARGESLLGEDQYASELFDAFNTLTNARRIALNRNRLRAVPTVAFGKRAGQDFRLEELNLNAFSSRSGAIRRIGNFAFYYLNRLTHLYLSHQRISHLPANAFDFERPSNSTLYIYLGNNRLNATSFEKGLFLNAKRPIHLELYWNPELAHLDEAVFGPFLAANRANRISLQDSPLTCDCNSYWLVRDRAKYAGQLLNVACKIGPKQTFSIDLIPFDKCEKNRTGASGSVVRRNKANKLTVVN